MLEKYINYYLDLFEKYGNPHENKNEYLNIKSEEDYNLILMIYDAYISDIDIFRITIASVYHLSLRISINEDLDTFISKVKNDPSFEKIELIRIESTIENIDDLKKIQEAFVGKEVYLQYDNIYSELNEIISSRYMIQYYKDLIINEDLSPIEQVMYAYDLIKSFNYIESDTDKSQSRKITKIVNSNKIVCHGYTKLFNKVLRELGFETFSIQTLESTPEKSNNHARSAVIINDTKYGLNDIYFFDATYDSVKNIYVIDDGKEIEYSCKKSDESYLTDPLVQNKYFCIPAVLYRKIFDKSSEESMVRDFDNVKLDKNIVNSIVSEDQIDSNLHALSLKDMIMLIRKIRLLEGYSEEELPVLIRDSLMISNYGFYSIEYTKNLLDELVENEKKI